VWYNGCFSFFNKVLHANAQVPSIFGTVNMYQYWYIVWIFDIFFAGNKRQAGVSTPELQ
jgi:hypothetical protein